MSPHQRRSFRPVPGTSRCDLCGAVEDGQHVRHPWWQIWRWLWDSHVLWRCYFVFGAFTVLTFLFAAIREFTPDA